MSADDPHHDTSSDKSAHQHDALTTYLRHVSALCTGSIVVTLTVMNGRVASDARTGLGIAISLLFTCVVLSSVYYTVRIFWYGKPLSKPLSAMSGLILLGILATFFAGLGFLSWHLFDAVSAVAP